VAGACVARSGAAGAGEADAGEADAGEADAGEADAGVTDAGVADAGVAEVVASGTGVGDGDGVADGADDGAADGAAVGAANGAANGATNGDGADIADATKRLARALAARRRCSDLRAAGRQRYRLLTAALQCLVYKEGCSVWSRSLSKGGL
jgi:hypothetical protein